MRQEALGKPYIIYEDDRVVGVFKPNRLLVHRTEIDYYERSNLRRWLAAELGVKVDPVHRLDKPTSGVVLFTKDMDALNHIKGQFLDHSVEKQYIALVRGYTEDQGVIEKPLQKDKDAPEKEALTLYRTLKHVEVPLHVSRYPTSRYSLVEVTPKTGRFHQIRMHFAHLRHPIVGDSRHGDRKHNHMFRDELQLPALFLHSSSLAFTHPDGSRIEITAPLPEHFDRIEELWNWEDGSGVTSE